MAELFGRSAACVEAVAPHRRPAALEAGRRCGAKGCSSRTCAASGNGSGSRRSGGSGSSSRSRCTRIGELSSRGVIALLARVLGYPEGAVAKALSPKGVLVVAGLVRIDHSMRFLPREQACVVHRSQFQQLYPVEIIQKNCGK
ncbi:MAG: hypothetical protein ACYC18_03245 [Gammaproteobacteria bacterium]|nr:hypothetical protein [Gammaproteobacteria bacterium]